jgi:hypothetical protein
MWPTQSSLSAHCRICSVDFLLFTLCLVLSGLHGCSAFNTTLCFVYLVIVGGGYLTLLDNRLSVLQKGRVRFLLQDTRVFTHS